MTAVSPLFLKDNILKLGLFTNFKALFMAVSTDFVTCLTSNFKIIVMKEPRSQ